MGNLRLWRNEREDERFESRGFVDVMEEGRDNIEEKGEEQILRGRSWGLVNVRSREGEGTILREVLNLSGVALAARGRKRKLTVRSS
ncbi:hypothetical protein CDL15_Pgr008707 [Punica granatum]|uniref:Uncharacterized protein n=1 Tax=Punica granatum TaxID=22663 RepID=A0A218WD84_PUNGR|nr:hypothetical protein CDL15_Pgr008707 [Punica granatum]